jgi:anti-sigma factor RsiW
MNETTNSQVCERAEDLISFLYSELSEPEARSFEQHRRSCHQCESEMAAFQNVRQSVRSWRDESLSLTISSSPAMEAPKRSALAAIRGFFELSPLWMKGASAFAAVLLCVLSVLAVARLFDEPQAPALPGTFITKEEFQIAVNAEAARLAQLKTEQETRTNVIPPTRGVEQLPAVNSNRGNSGTIAHTSRKSTKPLSRSERNQLAADLRLISDEIDDEDSLQLLGDRINR